VLQTGLYLVSEIAEFSPDGDELKKPLFYSLLEIAIVYISDASVILFDSVSDQV
jgi:hypothetical protein